MHLYQRLTFIISILLPASPIVAAQFIPLGNLPGGGFATEARDVSANGEVVVGRATGDEGGFRWTAAGGIVGMGAHSQATGTSADGSVLVGYVAVDSGNNGGFSLSARWTESTGPIFLGDSPGGAFAVNLDGTVIAGSVVSSDGENNEVFRWTSETGMVGLGFLPGGGISFIGIGGISGDGSVIVGHGDSPRSDVTEAFRWTESTGMVGLGDLPGGDFYSRGHGVSDDGSVVVGRGATSLGDEAFRWTESSGMVGLGYLPGGSFSSAHDVSADGSVVVGVSATDLLHGGAFIWTDTLGMQSIGDILVASGIDLNGWRLNSANAVSADGLVVVGDATDPNGLSRAWIARLDATSVPEPSATVLTLCALASLSMLRNFLVSRPRH